MMKKLLIGLAALGVFSLASSALAQNIPCFKPQGGASFVAGSGCIFDGGGQVDVFVLDADNDTTISAPTDDQIDIEISGADDFTFTANDFDVLAGSTLSLAGTAITASAAEINQAADNSANVEIVIATNIISAAESGKTFFLTAATEFVSTLPAPATGLRYKFIISAAPSGADYTIVTTASANIMNISITAITAGDAGELGQGQDVITFVGSGAPGPSIVGDWVECISDATSWFCFGTESIDTGITTGQTG